MTANASQIAIWNGSAGDAWVQYQSKIDLSLIDPTAALIKFAEPQLGENVLDVGCGVGETSRLLAHLVGTEGAVVGVDISAPMLAAAQARPEAKNLKYIEADASSHHFPRVFDLVISRFGVMFFDDPVSAFQNISRAMNRKGRFAFLCFRTLAENTFATTPAAALKDLLPARAPADPNAPGSFAFADPVRVISILKDAGFKNVEIQPYDGLIRLGSLENAALLLTSVIGPAAHGLENAEGELRRVAFEAVKSAIAPFETADGVNLGMACWLVRAS